jgi:hypothetical protein
LRELFSHLEAQRDKWLDMQIELTRVNQDIALKKIRIDILDELSNDESQLNSYLDLSPTARDEYVSSLVIDRFNNTME